MYTFALIGVSFFINMCLINPLLNSTYCILGTRIHRVYDKWYIHIEIYKLNSQLKYRDMYEEYSQT